MDVQHHGGASPYEGSYGFSRAVRIGDRIIVAGTVAGLLDPGWRVEIEVEAIV